MQDFFWPIHHQICAKKTRLYAEGQPPHSIFSIRRGFIKLSQAGVDGQDHILRILGPGCCIGMEALMHERYHHISEALTEIDFFTIPIKTIFQIEKEQPAIYEEIIKQWQNQLNQADIWLANLFSGTIKQRLCRFLIMQSRLQQSDDKIMLISNKDLASILATSNETVSRGLSNLRKEGVINKPQDNGLIS